MKPLFSIILSLIGIQVMAQISSVEGWVPQYVSSCEEHPTFVDEYDDFKYRADKNQRFCFDYPTDFVPESSILMPYGGEFNLKIKGKQVSNISIFLTSYLGGSYRVKRESGEEFFYQIPGHDPKKTKTLAKLHESYNDSYGDIHYRSLYADPTVKKELGSDYISISKITNTENETSYVIIIKQHPVSKHFYCVKINWLNESNKNGTFTQIAEKLKSSFKPRPVAPNQLEDIEGKVYSTITVGAQTWMNEHLSSAYFQQGRIEIPLTYSATSAAALCYKGDCTKSSHGLLYNGYALTDTRGLCPKGWHIPSKAEFEILAAELKAKSWVNNLNSFDEVKLQHTKFFSDMIGFDTEISYTEKFHTSSSAIWTKTPGSNGKLYVAVFYYDSGQIKFEESDKSKFNSCRCVKD